MSQPTTYYQPPDGDLTRLENALAALTQNPDSLGRDRARFSDSPPSYRSQESTAFPTPSPPAGNAAQIEALKWDLIQAHSASLPAYQFNAQVQVEAERISQCGNWRQREWKGDMDASSFAEDSVLDDWMSQGLCKREWIDHCAPKGRWKHEEPLKLAPAHDPQMDHDVEPITFGAIMAIRAAQLHAIATGTTPPPDQYIIRKHNREMSRPYNQFLAQVYSERRFLEYKLRQEERSESVASGSRSETSPTNLEWPDELLSALPPNLNTVAYENVLKTWKEQGLFLQEWGTLPGFKWLHETPLADLLREELGDDIQVPTTIFQGGPVPREDREDSRPRRRQRVPAHAQQPVEPESQQSPVIHDSSQHMPPTVPQYSQPADFTPRNLFGHPSNNIMSEEPGRDLFLDNTTATTGQHQHGQFSGFSASVAVTTEPAGVFSRLRHASQQSHSRETTASTRETSPIQAQCQLHHNLFTGDYSSRPQQQTQRRASPMNVDDDASTRPSSPASSKSSYVTGRSASSHTSTSNQKRASETPEPTVEENTPKSRRRRTSKQIEGSSCSSKRGRTTRSSDKQPEPKRRQQAPRGTKGKNGHASPPSSTEAPTQLRRRSPRLQKMKQQKGKGTSK